MKRVSGQGNSTLRCSDEKKAKEDCAHVRQQFETLIAMELSTNEMKFWRNSTLGKDTAMESDWSMCGLWQRSLRRMLLRIETQHQNMYKINEIRACLN